MNVRIGVLADYASMSQGHKLNILGIFTNIMAQTEPITHTQMKLVAQFEFNSSEVGNKNLKIELVDEDGREILSISGEIQIPHSPDGSPSLLNQILNFNNIVFPRFGEYEFRILLDGLTVCTIPLRVVRVNTPPANS